MQHGHDKDDLSCIYIKIVGYMSSPNKKTARVCFLSGNITRVGFPGQENHEWYFHSKNTRKW
jgi:hypothetical protein